MKILFKDNKFVYYILNNELERNTLSAFNDNMLINIQHLDNVAPLYTKVSKATRYRYNVYYIHNELEILGFFNDTYYSINTVDEDDTIDYTEANINKLLNGDII